MQTKQQVVYSVCVGGGIYTSLWGVWKNDKNEKGDFYAIEDTM